MNLALGEQIACEIKKKKSGNICNPVPFEGNETLCHDVGARGSLQREPMSEAHVETRQFYWPTVWSGDIASAHPRDHKLTPEIFFLAV